MPSYTFFGLQVLFPATDRDFRSRLHRIIAEGGAATEQSLADKRAFYKRFTTTLVEAVLKFDLGYWDYISDGSRAEKEFDTWCSELEGRMATEKEEVGDKVDELQRLSAMPDYVAVTLLFLLEAGGNSDGVVAERCDLPEDQWFKRETFERLVSAVPMLSFASVKADAVYLMPGNEQDGLSFDDVHGGGWEYLKQLS